MGGAVSRASRAEPGEAPQAARQLGDELAEVRAELVEFRVAARQLAVQQQQQQQLLQQLLQHQQHQQLVPRPSAPARAAPTRPRRDEQDWANGLPDGFLSKLAEMLVAQDEAAYEAGLKGGWGLNLGYTEGEIQQVMAKRKRDGNCLFVFAMVCKEWRRAQLKVGGPLRTRVKSDVIQPGSVALVKWALREGCPRMELGATTQLSTAAAQYGHMALVQWLIQEQGFKMDKLLMMNAAESGNVELVKWLRGEGCPLAPEWARWN